MTPAARTLIITYLALTLTLAYQIVWTEEGCLRNRITEATVLTARELGVWEEVLALLNRRPS